MEGATGTTLLLDELEDPETLLVYCGAEETEEIEGNEPTQNLQLSDNLDLQPTLSLDNEDDELWLVGNTLQLGMDGGSTTADDTILLGESGILGRESNLLETVEGETLLLLSDDVNLPFTQELPVVQESLNTSAKKPHVGVREEPSQCNVKGWVSRQKNNSNTSTTPSNPHITSALNASTNISHTKSAIKTYSVPITKAISKVSSFAVLPSLTTESKTQTVEKPSAVPSHSSSPYSLKPSINIKSKDTVNTLSLPQRKKGQQSYGVKPKLVSCSKSSIDEDELSEEPLLGPSLRWPTQPKSYRGAKARDSSVLRKNIRKIPPRVDTDGETSGMGSSVDEPVESSTESASEATPAPGPSFLQPRTSVTSSPRNLNSTSPTAVKKRRGGWPKGRKRKPELPACVKPPKAPLTAYVLFLNERRKYYKETRPDLRFGAVTKLLGAEWSSLTAEQKAAFVTRSEQDKRRYRNELQAYRQSHDYQLLLRKKRIKNVIKRGGTTTEESSDFTDEIDDDDSEELYCRICDQLFTSLHNKREHLYGKQHLQAITGEYQRERLAEEERHMAGGGVVVTGRVAHSDCLCGLPTTQNPRKGLQRIPGVCPTCSTTPRAPRTQDEDHDGDEEDEEEEDEEEEDEEEDDAVRTPTGGMTSMAEALEGVMAKVIEREREIAALEESREAARARNLQLAGGLLRLREQSQGLEGQQAHLKAENAQLKAEADTLWMLPALFGVTPLQMVDITLREQQAEEEAEETEEVIVLKEKEHLNEEIEGQQQQQLQPKNIENPCLLSQEEPENNQDQPQEELWESKLEVTEDELENINKTVDIPVWGSQLEQEETPNEIDDQKWIPEDLWDDELEEKWQQHRIWEEHEVEPDEEEVLTVQEQHKWTHDKVESEPEPDISSLLKDS